MAGLHKPFGENKAVASVGITKLCLCHSGRSSSFRRGGGLSVHSQLGVSEMIYENGTVKHNSLKKGIRSFLLSTGMPLP